MIDLYNDLLYPFQKKVVDKLLTIPKAGMWLEAGTGKTFTSLAIAQKRKKPNILVVCPVSKLVDWDEDIRNSLGMASQIMNKATPKKDQEIIDNFQGGAIVVSFKRAFLRNSIISLLSNDWIIIVDESQNAKNRTSKIGKWLVMASNKVEDVLLLSGTPVANGKILDWYNQLTILGLDMRYKDFENRFAIMDLQKNASGRRWLQFVESKNEEELHNAIGSISSFVKTDEVLDLPPKIFTDVKLIHDKKSIYNKVKRHSMYKELIIETAGTLFLRLRQLASNFIEEYENVGSHKKEALDDFFNESQHNTLIFYNFNNELSQIKEVAKKYGIKVFEINGHEQNYKEAKDFKERFIVAAQYQSGSAGIDGLQSNINSTLYYSPPLSSEQYEQSLARTWRNGQNKTAFYWRFITVGTIEEKIYTSLEKGISYTLSLFMEGRKNDGDL